jgi:hypothetical protein
MSKSNKPIDDFLKEQLSQAEPAFNEQEWLDFRAKYPEKRKRKGIIFWICIVGASIGLMGGGVYIFNARNTEILTNNTQPKNATEHAEAVALAPEPEATTSALPSVNSHTDISPKNHSIEVYKSKSRRNLNTQKYIKDNVYIAPLKNNDKSTLPDKIKMPVKEYFENNAPVNNTNPTDKSMIPEIAKENLIANTKPDAPKDLNSSSKKKEKNDGDKQNKYIPKIFIEGYIGSGIWKDENAIYPVLANSNLSINGKASQLWTAQLLGGLQLKPHWSIQSGLSLVHVSQAVTYAGFNEVVNKSYKLDSFLRMDTTARRIRLHTDSVLTISKTNTNFEENGKVVYQYIGIPLQFGYTHKFGKVSSISGAGLVCYIRTKYQIDLPSTIDNKIIQGHLPANRLAMEIRQGIIYEATKQMHISFMPSYGWIWGGSKKTNMLNISAGIRWTF